jgi:hypothetical protein
VYLVAAAGAVHAGAPPLRGGYFDVVLGEFVVSNLNGAQFMAANVLSSIIITFFTASGSYILLVSLRRLLRYQSLAVAGFCAVSYLWYSNEPQVRGEGLMLLTFPILLALWILITLRYGLLTLAITIFTYQLIAVLILTSDFAAWYGLSSLTAVLLVSALAIWAFRVSIGSRPLWSSAPQW